MTIPEFLERLRATPRDWRVLSSGEIRRGGLFGTNDCQCPVSAIVDQPDTRWPDAARKLGIDKDLAVNIVHAADWSIGSPNEMDLRSKIREACGV